MTMHVACVFKWARRPEDAWVGQDGTVNWQGAKFIASDDDAAAVVFARQLAQGSGGELVGVTIGDGDASWALARGAERVTRVADVGPGRDDARIAAALAVAVRRAGEFDVVVMGDAAEHAGVAAALGALLGMPVLTGVEHVAEELDAAGRVLVRRKNGTQLETLASTTPVLLAVAAAAAEKDIPGMKQLLAAKKRPVDTVSAPEVGAPAADTLTVQGSRPSGGRVPRLFDGDPASAARDLVAALRADGAL